MQQGIKEFQETLILKTAGNIFKQMIAENKLDELDDSQLILYQKAMELERHSQRFYLEKAEETTDSRQQNLFRKIAAEEEKHYFLLHNVYDWYFTPRSGWKMENLFIWKIINSKLKTKDFLSKKTALRSLFHKQTDVFFNDRFDPLPGGDG